MVSIRALRPEDDRSAFRSGNEDLDRFFRSHAGTNPFAEHIGTTYVALDDAGRILGYATLAASSVRSESFPSTRARKLPAYPLPALRLARLAVTRESRRQGIGTLLLRYAFTLALELAVKVGCVGVIVDAKPESVGFYERLGFERTDVLQGQSAARPAPLAILLWIGTIKKASPA